MSYASSTADLLIADLCYIEELYKLLIYILFVRIIIIYANSNLMESKQAKLSFIPKVCNQW